MENPFLRQNQQDLGNDGLAGSGDRKFTQTFMFYPGLTQDSFEVW